jgi:hypothetical protein
MGEPMRSTGPSCLEFPCGTVADGQDFDLGLVVPVRASILVAQRRGNDVR